jgi:hypothetical protein
MSLCLSTLITFEQSEEATVYITTTTMILTIIVIINHWMFTHLPLICSE